MDESIDATIENVVDERFECLVVDCVIIERRDELSVYTIEPSYYVCHRLVLPPMPVICSHNSERGVKIYVYM